MHLTHICVEAYIKVSAHSFLVFRSRWVGHGHCPPWHEPYLFHIPARGLHVSRYPFTTCFVTGPTPTPSTLLPTGLGYFRAKPSPVWIPQLFSNLVIHPLAYEDENSVPKRRHIKIQTPGTYPEENIQLYKYFQQSRDYASLLQLRHAVYILPYSNSWARNGYRLPQCCVKQIICLDVVTLSFVRCTANLSRPSVPM